MYRDVFPLVFVISAGLSLSAAPGVVRAQAAPGVSTTEVQAAPTETSDAEPVGAAAPDPLRLDTRAVGPNIGFRPGRGLRIESEDGQFQVNMRLRGQILYTYEQPNDSSAGEHALELRRARLAFSGHWWGEDNRYKIELAFAPRDQFTRDNIVDSSPATSLMLDWYLDFGQLRDLNVRVGQYKVNYTRERVISSADIPLVDRSIVNAEFNIDRDVGVEAYSRDFLGLDLLRYTAGLYVGRGRNSVGFDPRNHFMALGRIEVHPLGTFDDLQMVDLAREDEARLAIGVSAAYIRHANRNLGILGTGSNGGVVPDGVDLTTRHFAADMLFLYRGLSVNGEFHLRSGEQSGSPSDPTITWGSPRNGFGMYGEIGYVLASAPIGINARYSAIRPLGDFRNAPTATSLPSRNEAIVGATYYLGEHAYKVSADYAYIWNENAASAGDHRVRLQVQMAL